MKKILICLIAYILLISFAFAQSPSDLVIQLTTSTTENPPTISFKWNKTPEMSRNYDILINRKNKDSINWGIPIATLPNDATEFTDTNIELGVEYEYSIKGLYSIGVITYVNAGIKCKEVENRGKFILLVDSTFVNELHYELQRYESDLIGDGWQVLRKDISPSASVIYVKSIIHDFYIADPENVNTLFIFGHIPVPYSGNFAYDGHVGEHEGAWPADMYYGDMNEKTWTDIYVNTTIADRIQNQNIPGDGKFDLTNLPPKEIINLSVGRVDFHDLPDFPESEAELLRNYLNKNHSFRHKLIDPKMQALVDDNFGTLKYSGLTEAFAISGWRNFTALLNYENVKKGDFFSDTKDESFICSYGCGGGRDTSSIGLGTTINFANQSPKTVFTGLYGSRFGDWNTQNNFMRAALASNGWILTCCWAGRPHYTFHQMGMGATIGYCIKATQNNINEYYSGRTNRCIHESLLGDPSLRMHIVKPIDSVSSEVTKNESVVLERIRFPFFIKRRFFISVEKNKSVKLAWKQESDEIIGYYIYKLDTLTNKYNRITPAPVTETNFEDVLPDIGNNYYMIRSLKLSEVASGSYYNLSQGIFDTVRFEQPNLPMPEITLEQNILHSNALSDNQRYFNEPLIQGETKSAYIPEISGDNYVKVNSDNEYSGQSNSIFIPANNEGSGFTQETLIYPNPSTGLFNVSFGSSPVTMASLKIFDLEGKLVHFETFQKTTTGSFDISTLPKGVYIVTGIVDERKIFTKIVLQ